MVIRSKILESKYPTSFLPLLNPKPDPNPLWRHDSLPVLNRTMNYPWVMAMPYSLDGSKLSKYDQNKHQNQALNPRKKNQNQAEKNLFH